MSKNENYKVDSVDVGNLVKLIGAESLKIRLVRTLM